MVKLDLEVSKPVSFFSKLISIVFGAFLIYFLSISIFSSRYAALEHVAIMNGAVALLLVFWLIFVFKTKLVGFLADFLEKRIVLSVLFLLIFVGLFTIANALAIDPMLSGWDPQTTFQQAFILSGNTTLNDLTGYFQAYPNNLAIVGLTWLVIQVAQLINVDYITVTAFVNAGILTLAIFLTYNTVKRLFNAKIALIALILCLVIGLSPWLRTFYTDSVGMLFPVLSLNILVRMYQARTSKNRLLLGTSLGIVLGIGYLIKPTTIFIAIAVIMLVALYGSVLLYRKSITRTLLKKAVILALCVLFGFLLASVPIRTFMIHTMNLKVDSMPVSSFAMMGLTTVCTDYPKQCRYGAWNLSDALMHQKFTDNDVYREYTIEKIKDRVADYGFVGYLKFLSQKGAWVLGDGTFYVYNEGVESSSPFVHSSKIDQKIQNIMHPSGEYYKIFESILQTLWFVILISCVAAIILWRRVRAKSMKNYVFIITQITLLGLMVFLLFFEARSRYLFLYVPFFIILACYLYDRYLAKVSSRAKTLKPVTK